MEITKTKLRELGHDVVPFVLTEEDVQAFEKTHIDSMFIGLYWTCLETYFENYETAMPHFSKMFMLAGLPSFL